MEGKKIIFNIIGLIIGAMVLGADMYYLMKEKDDRESQKFKEFL